jgi:hypothetical protein
MAHPFLNIIPYGPKRLLAVVVHTYSLLGPQQHTSLVDMYRAPATTPIFQGAEAADAPQYISAPTLTVGIMLLLVSRTHHGRHINRQHTHQHLVPKKQD